jgi:hypothetical protein
VRSLVKKRYFLPVLSALVSLALFQLALHDPINARAFSSLEIPSIIPATEFDGVYTHLLARFFASIFGIPELSFRILTVLGTGFSIYFIQKLFPFGERWSIGYVIANISFLYFAFHSPQAMMIVLVFSAYLRTWERDGSDSLPMAGLLASLMLGFDSLLAVALIVYTLARIIGASVTIRKKIVAITSTILGASVWVLLAYMLYAKVGFWTAVEQGFTGLVTQVNPINFGVGLIVTFNLLLLWLFRSPSERTNTKYLGSLLIVFFLFIKVEPIHLVLLLILGVVYLRKTSGLPQQRWVQPAYALVNVGAFLLLPAVQPLEAYYNVRAERPSQAKAYYASYFSKHLPSYRSLLRKSGMLEASRNFVNEKSNVPVVLDPSTEVAYDRAALRRIGSRRMIGGFNMTSRRYKTVFGQDTSMMPDTRRIAYIRYLATDALPKPLDSLLRAVRASRSDRDGIRYYTVDRSQMPAFLDAYIYHHYLSYH